MGNQNKLDNIPTQEIKEMINNQIITIDQLDNDVLEKLIAYETDMLCLGEGDMHLIENYATVLEERNKDNYMSDERFMEIIQKSQNDHVIITEEKIENKHRFNFKRAVIIAAAVITLMVSCIMIAGAFGFDISYYIDKIIKDPVGSKIDVENITFYNSGTQKEYSAIEDLLENENLNILYPTIWPENIVLKSVRQNDKIDNLSSIYFLTNDPDVGFTVTIDADIYEQGNNEIYTQNDIVYELQLIDNIYAATCYYKNNIYYFSAYSKEDLILIINNIKEFNP